MEFADNRPLNGADDSYHTAGSGRGVAAYPAPAGRRLPAGFLVPGEGAAVRVVV